MHLSFTRACFHSRPFCSASLKPSGAVTKPAIPLFERPPIHSATSLQLQKWELNWLLEDALDNPSSFKYASKQGVCENVKLRASLDDLYNLWKERIENRRPLQYLVGCEHWRDLVLSVQEGVLIPRPETELIVDLVDEAVSTSDELRNGLWADLGTGSGALAIGVARVLGNSGRVIATDVSPLAVSVSSFNVQRYGLQNAERKLSGIVSNPPYIPSNNMPQLQAEVGRHEPSVALDGGDTGMDSLLQLCTGATTMLKPGGFFALETNGKEQCKYLVDYIQREGAGNFCNLNIVPDFAGIERFVTGFHK